MKVFPQSEWLSRGVSFGAETAGWMNSDELDMTQGPSGCQTVQSRNGTFPGDGRLRYANYGKGVAFWQTDAQAACFVNAVDIALDRHLLVHRPERLWDQRGWTAVNKPVRGRSTRPSAAAPRTTAAIVNRVRSLISPAGVEADVGLRRGRLAVHRDGSPGRSHDRAGQVRAAVWHSLIAGARGIIYFNHSFGGPCITQNVLRSSCGGYPAVRAMVTSVNAQIQSIAGALNGPKLTPGSPPARTSGRSAKWDGQNFYVLAGSAENGGPFQGQFSIPCVGNATATVLGENRTIPISAVPGRTHSPTATPSTSTASTAARPAACRKTKGAPRRSVGGALSRQRYLDPPARTVLSPFAELCGRS